jgi:hypothetical protein
MVTLWRAVAFFQTSNIYSTKPSIMGGLVLSWLDGTGLLAK